MHHGIECSKVILSYFPASLRSKLWTIVLEETFRAYEMHPAVAKRLLAHSWLKISEMIKRVICFNPSQCDV